MASGGELDLLFARMTSHGAARAIVEGESVHSYADLMSAVRTCEALLDQRRIHPGQVVGLQSSFTFWAIALLLALFRRRCIVAVLSPRQPDLAAALDDVHAIGLFTVPLGGCPKYRSIDQHRSHPLLDDLRRHDRAGLIIFSSGSSGRAKAILHDLGRLLAPYQRARKAYATLAFLLLDHIAGIDTAFYTLHAGGSLILVEHRAPNDIRELIERWAVEVLPVSPSFLKLLCLDGDACAGTMKSLKIITYGSEPMDRATLDRVSATLPHARLLQKYGASEFGAPSARTRQEDGLWIRLDSDHSEVRVEDGVLWLRTSTAMLGYLNADPPEIRDGWICTGDRVERDGDWLRVLGRVSDMINIGGEKVYPSEVEAVIRELDCVAEVAVSGQPHPVVGQIVAAVVQPVRTDMEFRELRSAILSHCLKRLAPHKVPVKISLAAGPLANQRQKIVRQRHDPGIARADRFSKAATPTSSETTQSRRSEGISSPDRLDDSLSTGVIKEHG